MSQYNLTYYQHINTTSFSQLTNKDIKNINHAYNISDESDFNNSFKLGACISSPKGSVCCG